jgi:hypothetical protein
MIWFPPTLHYMLLDTVFRAYNAVVYAQFLTQLMVQTLRCLVKYN